MKYAEITVFTKTKTNKDVFTYTFSDKLEIGQVVKVNFNNRLIYGIVLKISDKKPDFVVKNIIESLDIFVPKHLIETAFFISEHYFAPLSLTLKTMLPAGFYKKRRAQISKIRDQKLDNKDTFRLNMEQKNAVEQIFSSEDKKPFLLFGVTGSGKTEIYLRVIERVLSSNKGAIVLVPEIALTPQTIKVFKERFGDIISVLHSHLKETERQENWNEIASGKKRVVIGARSAIFAPVKNLGVIIVDEEHESSYKQENTPRYDARKVAEFISNRTGSMLIFGTATPRIESFFKTEKKDYHLLNLTKRVKNLEMPFIKIVDLKEEFHSGRKSILSYQLEEKLKEILENKRKAILFLNRRGNSTYVFCRDCGYIEKCPNCDIPLTQHLKKELDFLICHHCDFKKNTPQKCPSCQSYAIKFYGLGTQKAEFEIKKTFPTAKVLRLDGDSTKKRGSHKEIYEEFLKNDAGILIGTQMVAKGLDIKEVDLVGVINADYALNLPDFRATEKAFQLLTQVVGRSGRDQKKGLAIIQTYIPENSAILFLKKEDYKDFYESEIQKREKFGYPPFSKIIKLEVKDKNELKVINEAKEMAVSLEKKIKEKYNKGSVEILGPSPSFMLKRGGYFRWHILIKLKNNLETEKLSEIFSSLNNSWTIDIDT